MHSCTWKIGILITLGLSALAKDSNETLYEGVNPCSPLQYVKPDVPDKPDLLVTEEIIKQKGRFEIRFLTCRLGKDPAEKEGKLIANLGTRFEDNIEYDSQTGLIYKDEHNTLNKMFLANGSQSRVYTYPRDFFNDRVSVNSVALDWVTKNLFHFKDDNLTVINVENNTKAAHTLIPGLSPSYNVAKVKVFPNEGYLIIKHPNVITRYNQDATNSKVLYKNVSVEIKDIALDYYDRKIYWIENHHGKEQIRYTNLNGDETNTFHIHGNDKNVSGNMKYLQVDEKYVYYKIGEHFNDHIFRVRKYDGQFDQDFDIFGNNRPDLWKGLIEKVVVLSGNLQEVAKDHPCQHNNGGCVDYCVAVPEGSKLVKKCIDISPDDQQPGYPSIFDL